MSSLKEQAERMLSQMEAAEPIDLGELDKLARSIRESNELTPDDIAGLKVIFDRLVELVSAQRDIIEDELLLTGQFRQALQGFSWVKSQYSGRNVFRRA